jgi:DnaJ-class molecular chaperone
MHNEERICAEALCMTVTRGGNGACYGALQVHVRVKIPQKVGGEEKKLVEQLKTLEGSKEKAGSRWF